MRIRARDILREAGGGGVGTDSEGRANMLRTSVTTVSLTRLGPQTYVRAVSEAGVSSKGRFCEQ